MLRSMRGLVLILCGLLAIVLLSCTIDEDLRFNSDGSGSYRLRISIPKDLGEDFTDFRKSSEKEGFKVLEEGETKDERFIVLQKTFTDVSSLNDSYGKYELTMSDAGLFRRSYRFRATVESVALGGYKRTMVITMPGSVQSNSAGEVQGSRVTWDATGGGTIEISATGVYVPLSSKQGMLIGLLGILGLLLLMIAVRRRRTAPAAHCPKCNQDLPARVRFCPTCGATTS